MMDAVIWYAFILFVCFCVFCWIAEFLLSGYLALTELRDRRDEKQRRGRAR